MTDQRFALEYIYSIEHVLNDMVNTEAQNVASETFKLTNALSLLTATRYEIKHVFTFVTQQTPPSDPIVLNFLPLYNRSYY